MVVSGAEGEVLDVGGVDDCGGVREWSSVGRRVVFGEGGGTERERETDGERERGSAQAPPGPAADA